MKRTNLIIATAVMVLVALALYVLQKKRNNSTLDRTKANFAITDTARVSRVFIADKQSGRTYDLVRTGKRDWQLNGNIKVAWPMTDLMLATLHDLAEKAQATNELATSHQKVEVYQEGELVKTIYLGPEIDENKANYAMLEGQDQPWVIYVPSFVGFPSARFAVNPVRWRDKGLFASTPKTIQRIEVRGFGQPGSDVAMTFKGNRFSIEGALHVDTGRVVSFVNAFRAIYVEEYVVDKPTIDSIKALKPTFEVKVVDIDKAKSHVLAFFSPSDTLLKHSRTMAYIRDLDAVITIQEQNYKPILQRREWFEKIMVGR